jgi:hypothetical protein
MTARLIASSPRLALSQGIVCPERASSKVRMVSESAHCGQERNAPRVQVAREGPGAAKAEELVMD